MRSRIHAVVRPSELGDFAEELRRVFAEVGQASHLGSVTGECYPPIDVYETGDSIEIAMDLPGVDPTAVRIIVKGSSVLVAGNKIPRRTRGESSFHLVERGFGRFARTARLTTACDPAKAKVTLSHGELRITLPKIADRRGQAINLPIS
jgi:HSP20 family protein